jgi:hypothetical protein
MLMADEDVANAVLPHPHLPVLATSGIESTVKVGWCAAKHTPRHCQQALWEGPKGKMSLPAPCLDRVTT